MKCLDVGAIGRTDYPEMADADERRQAYQRALENARIFARRLCASYGSECELDEQPTKAEMTEYRQSGQTVFVGIQFTFRCHRPGEGCLTRLLPFLASMGPSEQREAPLSLFEGGDPEMGPSESERPN